MRIKIEINNIVFVSYIQKQRSIVQARKPLYAWGENDIALRDSPDKGDVPPSAAANYVVRKFAPAAQYYPNFPGITLSSDRLFSNFFRGYIYIYEKRINVGKPSLYTAAAIAFGLFLSRGNARAVHWLYWDDKINDRELRRGVIIASRIYITDERKFHLRYIYIYIHIYSRGKRRWRKEKSARASSRRFISLYSGQLRSDTLFAFCTLYIYTGLIYTAASTCARGTIVKPLSRRLKFRIISICI